MKGFSMILGRYVTVMLCDRIVIDNQEVPEITGGAPESNESQPGPIFIQGFHDPILFRNIIISPAH
jgi:hypothetical protein